MIPQSGFISLVVLVQSVLLVLIVFLPKISSSHPVSQIIMVNNNTPETTTTTASSEEWDAIIIGSGLAGLSAALTILDAGGRVLIVEKEASLGGNSMKASSGINSVMDPTNPDDAQAFRHDTLASAGADADDTPTTTSSDVALIETLVNRSHESVLTWLRSRLEVDLSQVAQLGGHSHPRTHRPGGKLPVGAEIMIKLQAAVKAFETQGSVMIRTSSRANKLLQDDKDGRVIGVVFVSTTTAAAEEEQPPPQPVTVHAPNVVLATGGFAADRSGDSWLAKVRPELLTLGATAGAFSTGDGLTMATSLQANLVGMEHIQVHPTGFVDPKDPDNPSKFLAAEVLRGVGGILLTPQGTR